MKLTTSKNFTDRVNTIRAYHNIFLKLIDYDVNVIVRNSRHYLIHTTDDEVNKVFVVYIEVNKKEMKPSQLDKLTDKLDEILLYKYASLNQ